MFFAALLDSERGQNRTGPCGLDEGAPDEKAAGWFWNEALAHRVPQPYIPAPLRADKIASAPTGAKT